MRWRNRLRFTPIPSSAIGSLRRPGSNAKSAGFTWAKGDRMPAQTWKRIEELFEAALAQPAQQRAQFLEQACPDDPDIRVEVVALLKSSDLASSFLEDSPMKSARATRTRARIHTKPLRNHSTDRAGCHGRSLSRA